MSAHGYTSIIICLPDATVEIMNKVAAERGRSIADLAESAVEEAALAEAKARGWLRSQCPHCDE